MYQSFFFLLLIVSFTACADEQKIGVILNNAPYAALTDSIEQAPLDAELYYKRGVLLYEKNELEHARTDIEKAWNISPNENYALSLARLIKQKSADSAVLFLLKALRKIPQSIALQVSLARIYSDENNLAKALSICNAIIEKYPAQLDALLLKADILSKQNKETEATAVLEQAYSFAPFDAELAHNLAFRYAEAKNSKVLLLSDSLIKADVQGTHAEPYLFKGIYYYNLKNYSAALKAFNNAIVKDYNFLDAHMYKGQLFYDQKAYTEAFKTFSLVTSISPTYAEGYYWLGKTGEAQGSNAEAELNYQRAYELDKTLVEAKEAAERL